MILKGELALPASYTSYQQVTPATSKLHRLPASYTDYQ